MESVKMSYNYCNEMSPEMDLLAASSIGDLGLVHRLLQQGANVDLPNESGWTPLMYAAHYGHYNVVKMLIDYGANVNISEKIQGRTPLMLAASCGHTRCLEVLITLGAADIEMTDSQGHNAAYYAIHSGHGRNKIIAKLLKIQGKSRSSSSTSNNSSTSTSIVPAASTTVSSSSSSSYNSGNSRTRPLTKGRPDLISSGNNHNHSTSNNHGKHLFNSRNQHTNETVSSSKVTSTTKPDIIISRDNIGPILEDSSPFPHGNGNSKLNDDNGNCAYYSPYLPLSRDGSPIGGQFSPSSSNYISPSTAISSPFNLNNGFTPQLTFDRLLGKRRLPMGNQGDRNSSQPAKSLRREQITSSVSSTSSAYNNLLIATSQQQQQQPLSPSRASSSLSTASSNSLPLTVTTVSSTSKNEEFSSKDGNGFLGDMGRSDSMNDFTQNKRSSPGIIGSNRLNRPSPSHHNDRQMLTASPNCSGDGGSNISDSRLDSGINCSNEICPSSSPSAGTNSGDETSLPIISSDASSNCSISSSVRSDGLNRSRSPLPENLETLLERIGLSQYSSLFAEHGIDLYCFLTLNEADFEEIGITLLGHKRKLYMAQLRFRESVEIASTQERFFADWLLSERENLKKENHELKMKLKGTDTVSTSISSYN